MQGFEDPQVSLEQYLTPPHLAACVLALNAAANEDIEEDKDVADLGCGTGMCSGLALKCLARREVSALK